MSAFADLTLNEIEHIVHVMMRDDDIDEDDESEDGQQTIKRQPTNESSIYENDLDTNNNSTLKRTSSKDQNNDRSTLVKGIPQVPRVHMGAGFMKIFNQCPLDIHHSYCWIDPETEDQYVLFASEQGIYSLNLNEIHDASLELVSICSLMTMADCQRRNISAVVSSTNDLVIRERSDPLVDLGQIEFTLPTRSPSVDAA